MPVRMLAVLALAAQSLFVAAQTSSVVCVPSYVWAENSLGQNPCIVTAYLLRPCGTTVVDVPVLPVNQHYNPGDSSDCNCNTVVYSLVSACADCQTRQYDTWSLWSQNCSAVYKTTYPHGIPLGTAVPAWAYLDVTIANNYDSIAAMNDHAAESTAVGASSSFTISFPTTLGQSASASSTPKQLNVGAIAGGAVAGLVVIGAAIAAIVWIVVRNNRQTKRRGQDPDPNTGVKIASQPNPPMANEPRAPLDNTSYVAYTGTTPSPAPMSPIYPMPRLYDPADPSTFPPRANPMMPPSSMGHTSNTQSFYTPPNPSEPNMFNGGYSSHAPSGHTPSSPSDGGTQPLRGYTPSVPSVYSSSPPPLYGANQTLLPPGPIPPYSTVPEL